MVASNVCTYVCIDSSARRPNHTSYDKKTAVVSNFRSSGYATKCEQLTEVWEVSERNLGRERTLKKHCARLLGAHFSHVALHVRKASKEQKPEQNDVFFAVSVNGRGPGSVREGPGRRSGEGPERVPGMRRRSV